jgi:hypothetical protein
MIVRATRWVLPLAFTVLAALVGGPSLARAADDVRPPTLVCVDGLLTMVVPRPGERLSRRRRWWTARRTACVPSGVAVACAPNARFRASGATSQSPCRSVSSNRKEA